MLRREIMDFIADWVDCFILYPLCHLFSSAQSALRSFDNLRSTRKLWFSSVAKPPFRLYAAVDQRSTLKYHSHHTSTPSKSLPAANQGQVRGPFLMGAVQSKVLVKGKKKQVVSKKPFAVRRRHHEAHRARPRQLVFPVSSEAKVTSKIGGVPLQSAFE